MLGLILGPRGAGDGEGNSSKTCNLLLTISVTAETLHRGCAVLVRDGNFEIMCMSSGRDL